MENIPTLSKILKSFYFIKKSLFNFIGIPHLNKLKFIALYFPSHTFQIQSFLLITYLLKKIIQSVERFIIKNKQRYEVLHFKFFK